LLVDSPTAKLINRNRVVCAFTRRVSKENLPFLPNHVGRFTVPGEYSIYFKILAIVSDNAEAILYNVIYTYSSTI
jgi:hypothetical protein